MKRFIVWLIKKSRHLSALSMRLVKLTGKSRYVIHPKHLIRIETPWYLKKIQKNDVILDLGCNNGQHTIRLAKHCRRVIGVDYDQKQLEIAAASARDQKVTNIKFIRQDLEKKLNFPEAIFSKIIFLDVLEHLVNRRQILQEISRVLKPKGWLYVAIPNSESSWKRRQRSVGINSFADPDHKIEFTPRQAQQILTDNGFKIISFSSVTFDSPWIGFIDIIGGLSLSLYSLIIKWKKKKAFRYPQETTGFRIIAENLK